MNQNPFTISPAHAEILDKLRKSHSLRRFEMVPWYSGMIYRIGFWSGGKNYDLEALSMETLFNDVRGYAYRELQANLI